MKYQIQTLSGKWVDKTNLESGIRAEIVSETKPIPSQFQDEKGIAKNQDVAKILLEGASEPVNVALNRTTIAGLINAFGDDSNDWQKHTLTIETEKMRVAGKAVIALYLIPDGYQKTDNDEGYAVIVKAGEKKSDDDLTEDDLPPIE